MILILGGAGYIGSHVNGMLAEQGYQTLVLDNFSTGHREFVKWGKLIEGNLGDVSLVKEIFTKYSITAVMHFAAYIAVGESVIEPLKYYQNNVGNTLNFLQTMIDTCRGLKKTIPAFIFSSTAAVFGNPLYNPIDEEHTKQPINPYGWSKLMIEQMLDDFHLAYQLPYVVFRYFNASGRNQHRQLYEKHEPETHLLPLLMQTALGKRPSIDVFGSDYDTPDGSCIRDYIHVDDLAQAHILAMQKLQQGEPSAVFNLGTGQSYSVLEAIATAEKVFQRKINFQLKPRRAGDAARLVASSEKIRRLWNWQAQYRSLQDILVSLL